VEENEVVDEQRSTRFNVQLDDEHAAKLHAVAERVYVQPGTIARALLSTALDQAAPDAATITELLDSIPGAWERAQEGLAAARAGRFLPLDEL
jgi:predicted transcriptional regulator